MLNTVRAVVKRGRIEPLEEIYIPEGTEVLVTILIDSKPDFSEFRFETRRPSPAPVRRNVPLAIQASFKEMFSESGRRVIRNAIEESHRRDQNLISMTHIFFAMTEVENELFVKGMQAVNLDPKDVTDLLKQELAKIERYDGNNLYISKSARDLFDRSLKRARLQKRQTIESLDLFICLFADPNGVPAEVLRSLGADPSRFTDSD